MKVEIAPLYSGCIHVVLSVLTLGVYPLAKWLNERKWPRLVDEQGLTTRGGIQIAWSEFTKIKKVVTQDARTGIRIEHYELSYPKGKVVVATYRLVNGDQVFEYIWQHLPEQIKQA